MPTLDEVRERYPNTPAGLEKVREALELLKRVHRNYPKVDLWAMILDEFGVEARDAWAGDETPESIHAALWPPEPERKAVRDMTLAECVNEAMEIRGGCPTSFAAWGVIRDLSKAAILAAELMKRLPKLEVLKIYQTYSGEFRCWVSTINLSCSPTPAEAMLRALLAYERERGKGEG